MCRYTYSDGVSLLAELSFVSLRSIDFRKSSCSSSSIGHWSSDVCCGAGGVNCCSCFVLPCWEACDDGGSSIVKV